MDNSKYKDGYKDFEWAVKLNRIGLEAIGLWPKIVKSPRQRLLYNLRVFIVFWGITVCLLVPGVHSLIKIYGDVMLMIDNLQFTLPFLSCIIRIGIFWWKKKAIVAVINMVEQDWVNPKSKEERNIMVRRAQIARIIITCAYSVMVIVGWTFLVVLPSFGLSVRLLTNITDPGRPLPFQSYYIYDVTSRPQYELTFISQTLNMFVAILIYSGIDTFLGMLILHICGQLDILKNRLINLNKYNNFCGILKICVTKHIRLLRAINIIEDAYNITLIALFVYFGILFAFYGFLITTLFQRGCYLSTARSTYLFSNIINVFAHMCLYCALGEILMAQCNEIYHAAYSSEWYTVDPKFARDLLPILIRSTKPVYLTAGKIFPMTMSTFCSLLKTSAGYVSVLHTMRI